MVEKQLLRLVELAVKVGVSPRVLNREVRAGRLPACRIGRYTMVAPSDVAKYLGDERARDLLKGDK